MNKDQVCEMIENTMACVVLNDEETFTDIEGCNVCWSTHDDIEDENFEPLNSNVSSVSVQYLLDYFLENYYGIKK